jgi:Zn-finger nucleic acid-binding protein
MYTFGTCPNCQVMFPVSRCIDDVFECPECHTLLQWEDGELNYYSGKEENPEISTSLI